MQINLILGAPLWLWLFIPELQEALLGIGGLNGVNPPWKQTQDGSLSKLQKWEVAVVVYPTNNQIPTTLKAFSLLLCGNLWKKKKGNNHGNMLDCGGGLGMSSV